MTTTEKRDALRESNRRRGNPQFSGLDNAGHFPSIVYKRCTACGWEIATRRKKP